ncbi:MAG: DUF1501 domain-containing protein, partial [Planctomycetia bacterium]|nr:DUF1501 domain-containing protein [Planctomycetia bacterium]
DHGRASYFLRTGYMPQGQVQYPTLGSLVAKELADEDAELPSFVSIAPYRFLNQAAYGPGFLGHEYAPLIVGENGFGRPAQPGAYPEDAALRVKDLSTADGTTVEDRVVSVPDFIATVCTALGVDPRTQNVSNVGRPIRIADPAAKPITEALA